QRQHRPQQPDHQEPEHRRPYLVDFGSSASRSESPKRLKASTSTKIAMPGTSVYVGSDCRYGMLRKIIRPRSGVGSVTPTLMNDSAASPVTNAGTASENATRIGAHRFGSNWANRMCGVPAPAARAASTNSRSRRDSTWPRTSRAVYVHENSANTAMISPIRKPAG